MKQEIKALTLNGRFFPLKELDEFCREEISKNISPAWQLDIFRFILDFLSESEFIYQQTSGSTGAPKTIQLSKKAMLKSAENTVSFFNLERNQKAVLCLPVKYIAGKMMIVRAFLAQMNLVLIEPDGTPDFSKLGEVDFCAMVPMQAANLLEQNNWPNIKTLILGGAETSSELFEKLQKVKTEVFETYGMAETCSHIALKQINGENPQQVFTTLPGIRISKDERDCLVIDAPFLKEKIITNDCIELVSENKFKWLGRIDNVINSGGIKIQPEMLEKKIEEILQKSCVILSEPDEILGQKLVLVIESEKPENPSQIQEKLAPHFDKKMLPKSVWFLAEFPRNKSFKIDRKMLKEWGPGDSHLPI
ncbi:MAG TPA: AMP-binding protein [Draconibacterium sp.]|nr:AMP-binding protein [Draconibacterium sp.]